jgi:outer membrane beta-barrel protein
MARSLLLFGLIFLAQNAPTFAANPLPSAKQERSEKVNVDPLKKKYWQLGDSDALRVVQHRVYRKKNRLSLGLSYGSFNHDPFLSSYSLGGTVGYHFTEYLGISFLYWKITDGLAKANEDLITKTSIGVSTNPVSSLMGVELTPSLFYGKLSFLGEAIVHFDLHFLAGLGLLSALNGTYLSPWIGIGQQIYITQYLAVRADYRLTMYSEDIIELYRPATLGQISSSRTTYAGAFTLGLSFLLF